MSDLYWFQRCAHAMVARLFLLLFNDPAVVGLGFGGAMCTVDIADI